MRGPQQIPKYMEVWPQGYNFKEYFTTNDRQRLGYSESFVHQFFYVTNKMASFAHNEVPEIPFTWTKYPTTFKDAHYKTQSAGLQLWF